MATVIRLRRVGKKKHPFYRVVVQDGRSAPGGVVIEELGTYQPKGENPKPVWNHDRVQDWLKRGAVPSDTVKSLLRRATT